MSSAIHQSYTLLLILAVALFSSSFSLAPSTLAPPEAQKSQQQTKKGCQRLRKRLKRTNNIHQKKRLQKRLERLEKRGTSVKPSPLLGVLGFGAGILALLVFISSLGVGATALSGTGLLLANFMFWGGIVLAVIGLGLSIVYLVLRRQNPDCYSKPGFAIAGIILNGLLVG